ncbi:MAG: hypothetical protein ACYDD1_22655, partial [Caulobacteraceae bacterium]
PIATSGPAAGLAPVGDGDVPRGAPSDDYGLVAWCRGALTGHMALYPIVEPELKSIERAGETADDVKADHEQMEAGRDYIALYTRAIATTEKASRKPLHERGVALEAQGEGIWTAAKDAQPRARMWTWLMWDLPGRCEVAAKRLERHEGITTETAQAGAVQTDTAQAPAAETPATEAAPAAAQAAPQSIDDALPASTAAPADAPAPTLRGPQ